MGQKCDKSLFIYLLTAILFNIRIKCVLTRVIIKGDELWTKTKLKYLTKNTEIRYKLNYATQQLNCWTQWKHKVNEI